MRNKKNGFFTFIFSLLPGAGEMYFGLYRQGLLLMSMFFGSIAICALTGMGELAFVLPIIWCFGFFHVHNLKNMSEEEFGKISDEKNFIELCESILPNGMDPDEYLKSRGKDSFLEFIESNQKDVYGYLYSNAFLNRNLNVAYDYEEVKKTVFNLLFKSGSALLVEKYLHQLAIDLKVSYDAIYNDYNIYFKQGSGQKNVEVLEETPKISKEMKAHEKWFIYFIAYNKNFLDYFKNEIGEVSDYIENEVILRTYQAIVYFYNSCF